MPQRALFLLSVAAGLAFFTPAAASAQSFSTPSTPFTINLSPQFPSPGGQVTVSVLSTSLALARGTLTISVNGQQAYQGNVQPVGITAGAAGTFTTIKATITINGTPYTQTLLVRPQDVALVAEPAASVPPLYPGKPSVPLEGSVRVVAVANVRNASGKVIDPAALSYDWKVDNTEMNGASGIGKSSLIVDSPLQYRSRTVSITVSSQDASVTGGSSLVLEASAPSVRVYVNDPLLGILFDHALADSFAISGSEVSLYAAPFSFMTSTGAPSVQWFLDGASAQTGNVVTLRPTGNGKGSANLSLVASAGQFAKATQSLLVSFGASSGSSLFGL